VPKIVNFGGDLMKQKQVGSFFGTPSIYYKLVKLQHFATIFGFTTF